MPCEGEVRYTWKASQTTTPAYALSRFTFTGQYSYMDDPSTAGVTEGFGLMFYNARWYDPYLNHFTQPDSIVPDPYNSQDYDRYAYARNNPVRYTDPTGHRNCEEDGYNCPGDDYKPTSNWLSEWLQEAGDLLESWFIPTNNGPVILPVPQVQSPFQLQQNATATPRPPTSTPQSSGQATAQVNTTATAQPTATSNGVVDIFYRGTTLYDAWRAESEGLYSGLGRQSGRDMLPGLYTSRNIEVATYFAYFNAYEYSGQGGAALIVLTVDHSDFLEIQAKYGVADNVPIQGLPPSVALPHVETLFPLASLGELFEKSNISVIPLNSP